MAGAITDNNIVICVTGPEKEGVTYPTAEQAIAAIKEVQTEEITAYVDEVSNEPLISKELNAVALSPSCKALSTELPSGFSLTVLKSY